MPTQEPFIHARPGYFNENINKYKYKYRYKYTILIIYFFICACLLIFFDFLQSDWLHQRAAFYDILTVVPSKYNFYSLVPWSKSVTFLRIDRSEKLRFEVENRQKI